MLGGGGSAVCWALLDEPFGILASYMGWIVGLPLLVLVSLVTEHGPEENLEMFSG
jgi:hypothetical protein